MRRERDSDTHSKIEGDLERVREREWVIFDSSSY